MVRREFGREGHTDPGEAAALEFLAPRVAGARVLDIGIGTGRTTTLLAGAAASYVGVDISPGMIAQARRRHPAADLRVGDARHLDFPDDSFDVAVFSFNGLDAVAHDERRLVLDGIARVLAPGGRVLISSLNIRGPAFGETPSTARSTNRPWRDGPHSPRKYLGALWHRAQAEWFFRRSIRRAEQGEGWAIWPMAAHDFRFVVHFTELGPMVRSLRAAGLAPERAWASEGHEIDLAAETCDADYVHFVAGAGAG
ncbi:MAG: Methylase [Solirubrobacterales bacterium]|nr:Methylase [Solirubrobacterales bacterium]